MQPTNNRTNYLKTHLIMETTTFTIHIDHFTVDGLDAIFPNYQDFNSQHLYHFQDIKTTELGDGYLTEIKCPKDRRFDFIDDLAIITSNLVRYLTTAHGDDTIFDYAPDAAEIYKNTIQAVIKSYNSISQISPHEDSMIEGLINIANQAILLFNQELAVDPDFLIDLINPDILENL